MSNNNLLKELINYEFNLELKKAVFRVGKTANDNCSEICDMNNMEVKILMENYSEIEHFNFKKTFVCFDACLSKYFDSALYGLNIMSNHLNKNF